jgi:hypothetical protein
VIAIVIIGGWKNPFFALDAFRSFPNLQEFQLKTTVQKTATGRSIRIALAIRALLDSRFG